MAGTNDAFVRGWLQTMGRCRLAGRWRFRSWVRLPEGVWERNVDWIQLSAHAWAR